MKDHLCPVCGAELKRTVVAAGHLQMDVRLLIAKWKGHPVRLSPQEIAVVQFMAGRPGSICAKWAIHEACLGGESEIKIVDVYICKIRAKFKKVDPEFSALITVWGEGYIWDDGGVEVAAELDRQEAIRARIAKQ